MLTLRDFRRPAVVKSVFDDAVNSAGFKVADLAFAENEARAERSGSSVVERMAPEAGIRIIS